MGPINMRGVSGRWHLIGSLMGGLLDWLPFSLRRPAYADPFSTPGLFAGNLQTIGKGKQTIQR